MAPSFSRTFLHADSLTSGSTANSRFFLDAIVRIMDANCCKIGLSHTAFMTIVLASPKSIMQSPNKNKIQKVKLSPPTISPRYRTT